MKTNILFMKNSSKSIRILNVQSSNKHHQPLIVRIKGHNNHSRSNLATKSALNMKRISTLSRQLDRSNELHQRQIDSFIEESKLCQIELIQKVCQTQFSSVYRVRLRTTGKHYALKKIIVDQQCENRQEEICLKLKSNFIVRTIDIYKQTIKGKNELNILMDLYDWNLKDYINSQCKIDPLVYKIICYQMARSVFYIHSKGITHRDINPSNFVMKKNGRIALCDFGSAKQIKFNKENFLQLNSRCYRAPQLLLKCKDYDKPVDIWALACVMIQLLTKKQIFKGSSSLDCLLNITRIIGSRELKKLKGDEQLNDLIPIIKGIGISDYLRQDHCPILVDLLSKMLRTKSKERIRAIQVLAHPFFDQIRQEQTYKEILNSKIDISDFFNFSKAELRNCQEYKTKIIPVWKRDLLDKY